MKNRITDMGTVVLMLILIVVIAVPFAYIHYSDLDMTFWDSAMASMFASILSLVAGIPIALWIDRLVKNKEEKNREIVNQNKEMDMLRLVKEELEFSYKSIFLAFRKGNFEAVNIQQFKSDLWDSFVASGDLKYINDPLLLNRIASAYYVLKIVKNIENQAYLAQRTIAIRFTRSDGTQAGAAAMLLHDARWFDALFEDSVKEALKSIDVRLNQQ